MFGPLGFQEVLLILVVALLIFGPRKLPEIGRTIGRTLSEFRKASNELKRSLDAEMIDDELRQSDPRRMVRETVAEVKSLGSEKPAAAGDAAAPKTAAAAAPEKPAAVPRGAGPGDAEPGDAGPSETAAAADPGADSPQVPT